MTDALDCAWERALGSSSQDGELGRLIMASAIIEQVDLGVRVHEELVRKATAALAAAARLSPGRERPRSVRKGDRRPPSLDSDADAAHPA